MDSGQWRIDNGQMIINGQWAMENGQLIVDNGHHTKLLMVNCKLQLTIFSNNRQPSTDNQLNL